MFLCVNLFCMHLAVINQKELKGLSAICVQGLLINKQVFCRNQCPLKTTSVFLEVNNYRTFIIKCLKTFSHVFIVMESFPVSIRRHHANNTFF